MLMTKLKVAAAIFLVVGVAGSGAGVLTYGGGEGEQPKHRSEKLTTLPANEPQEQKAEAPPAGRAREDKIKRFNAELRRVAITLGRARNELSLLESQYQRHEREWVDESIKARLRLMETEDQLKRIEKFLSPLIDQEYAEVKRLEAAVKELQPKERPRLADLRERLREAEEAFKKNEQSRIEQLSKARTEFLQVEAQYKSVERLQAFRRDTMVRKLEAANERVLRLEEESRRVGGLHEDFLRGRSDEEFHRGEPAKELPLELEQKLDGLLREMAELRREIRRQQTDKGPNPSPERRPDQP
jgi:hypothetical protein